MAYSVAPSIIQGNLIADNYSEGNGEGGGIMLNRTEGIRIKNNRFTGNEATEFGGGLRLHRSHGIIVKNNHFEGNKAWNGAGLYSYHFEINQTANENEIAKSVFIESGHYEYQNTSVDTIKNNKFIQNEAVNSGGGLYVRLSPCSIIGNEIRGNSCNSYHGGGISIHECSPDVVNNLIVDNKAGSLGGGICVGDLTSRPVLINNTIVANTALLYGGGFYCTEASPVIFNSILWYNEAPNGDQIYLEDGSIQVAYSNILWGWDGEGNIDLDPLFALNDSLYHLSDSSPCINAGIDSLLVGDRMCYCPSDDYETDMNFPFEDDGMPRPFPGTRPDMGADETDVPVDIEIEQISDKNLPQNYTLGQNYPNPFNPNTTIEFRIPKSGHVRLTVFNLLGEEIAVLVSQKMPAGSYTHRWDADGMANGIYYYKLEVNDFVDVKKGVLLK